MTELKDAHKGRDMKQGQCALCEASWYDNTEAPHNLSAENVDFAYIWLVSVQLSAKPNPMGSKTWLLDLASKCSLLKLVVIQLCPV